MENKRIIFTKQYTAEIVDCEIDPPKDDEVLVRLVRSSISSGTERANIVGDLNISITYRYDYATYPRSGGYSSAGIVEATGDKVTSVKKGDRVAVSWSNHGKYVCLKEENITKLPDDIGFTDAALFHIGTFPMAAVRKCHLEIGESAIVMGLGVLGLIAVQLLRAAGAAPVIAADPVAEKREQALKFGADHAFDPLAPDFAEQVRRVTGKGANVAIEVTGYGSALDQVLDCMAPFGRVALLGCTRNSDFTIDYYHKVHGPGISLIGAHTNARPLTESSAGLWTTRDDVAAQIRLTQFGRLHLADMVEEIHSPSEAGEVYTRLAHEKSFPLVQFDWSDFE